jgi:hypothetical protein
MAKFLAIYTGTPSDGPGPDMDPAALARGMQAWTDWMAKNAGRIVESGGPLGRTKKVSKAGVADIRNNLAGYVLLEADDHDAAAALFRDHPHFTVFPGDGVEIMPVLPIPGS